MNASAEGGQTKTKNDQKARDFYAKFSFTQVPIARPWFEPGFFAMRSWTVDENWKFSYGDDPVSGGSDNPVGRLVAYPVTALFVRDVEIRSTSWSDHADFVEQSISAGGSVGYGPFRIGGKYSTGSEQRNTQFKLQGDTLRINGMQLIGTVNNLVPACPNLHPAIKLEDLVGGS